ncbi:branched-chain amino acid transaminase [Endozoicomonas sp. SM1973]|uniref:Branched-chain-amino-acid aminotransferase n=1 Tax=Spartinivicinus marinus TaxID=2994442 RepID=A0A853IIH0_9GAMM|nr:branched-chain amino acid transaminase [Spartinivicinus marinus]MCX4027518.1 branched-chain amino acid transaminase [Spartinivicinus marinus]NYZ68895.1 branched-chain amino acid transaminase [Spartinivicinus marinus]
MSALIHDTSAPKASWIVYSDGDFKKLDEVNFYTNNQALNYGTGVFEGIRAYWSSSSSQLNLFRVEEHYVRLIESAKALKIDLGLTINDLVEITIELIKINNFKQDIYIRPMALKKSLMPGEKFGVKLSGVSSTLCINAMPMGQYVNSLGINCLLSSWQRVSKEAIPSYAKITGLYVNSALAYEEAREEGFDDAIMLNSQGDCTEATTSNVFIVSNDTVKTPPPSAGLLNGITRQSVFELCSYLGISCIESNLNKQDLLAADECFLTGTGVEILPVIGLNQKKFGDSAGRMTTKISELYDDIKKNRVSSFSHWITPVY